MAVDDLALAHDLIESAALVRQLGDDCTAAQLWCSELSAWQAETLPVLRELRDELGDQLLLPIPPGPTRLTRWRDTVAALVARAEAEQEQEPLHLEADGHAYSGSTEPDPFAEGD